MAKDTRSASSKRWLQEHVNDQNVKEANKRGLRYRAFLKIE